MYSVIILVGLPLAPESLDRIERLDGRVALLNRRMPPLAPASALFPPFPQELLPLLEEAEVLFTLRLPLGLPGRAPRLRWVQAYSAGLDTFVTPELAASDIVVTSSSGAHAVPTAESVVGAILALAKSLPQAVRRQARREWLRTQGEEVAGKTVGIIGGGHIGSRVAELCKALGMRVLGVRRSVAAARGPEGPFDLLLPPLALGRLLAESDYVVVTAPHTPETRGLLGEREFQQMKPGARLINVSRGELVDETALVRALQSRRIGGAYLDVFQVEPLPPESPLWEMPNVLITSHSAGNGVNNEERIVELFVTNLRRYLSGEPLLNVYQRGRGY